ncbi:MAG: signal peptide peptidase SppA [Treponema sp.]|jgi:protease-4|nr:signal peptide peptidase SppA [Treponema sp.]
MKPERKQEQNHQPKNRRKKNKMKNKPVYLELNLNNTRPRPVGLIRSLPRPYSEIELLWLIKRAATDKKLKGMVLNTSGFTADRSFLWELRTALETFRSAGKKIIAYFEEADFDLYSMVCAADKIVMDRNGNLSFMGYTMGRLYLRDTLGKLGVGFRELRYLDYKTANEMYSRADMSEADREQYGAYLDDIFLHTKNTIINARSLDEERFNLLLGGEFILPPEDALEKGLVDILGREGAIETAVREMEKSGNESEAEPVYKTWGVSSLMIHGRHVSNYDAPGGRGRKAEIAVVLAKGNTGMDEGMSARNLSRIIYGAAEKPSVKALVLRVDSPGGSAVAADYIAEAVEKIKKDKPVVVTLGQVAASGGYWAAMTASKITASPYTLTGSIGVIAGWFFNKSLNEKLGVNVDSMSVGDHADLLNGFLIPQRDITPEEETRYHRFILELYNEFVKKAAIGRNMKEEELEPLARGRIYSGGAALKLKLIDSLGGYLEAIETSCKLAEIPEKRKIVIKEYPKPRFLETLAARFFSSSLGTTVGAEMFPALKNICSIQKDLSYRLSNNGKAMPILPIGIIV